MASVEDSGIDRFLVGGGASHTAESARRQTYAATGGAEGVGGLNDLVVRPLALPGAGVRVALGTALIHSNYAGGDVQTYMGAVFREVEVAIAPNTTQNDRYDLVVFRVEDPHAKASPWPKPDPADIPDEQYLYVRVIPNVGASVKRLQDVVGGTPAYATQTGIALARVKVPAMKQTVELEHIVNLRTVAQPKSLIEVRAFNLISDPSLPDRISAQSPSFETWPLQAQTAGVLDVDIPDWASVAKVIATVSEAVVPGTGNAWGEFQVQIGATANEHHVKMQATRWSIESSAFAYRRTLRVADTKRLPKELRGTRQRFFPRANRQSGTEAQAIYADSYTSFDLLVVFQEEAD